MSDTNPYGSSNTSVYEKPAEFGKFIPNGRVVDSGSAINWFKTGFELFKRAPGIWIANIVIFFVIFFILGMIPFLGSVATYLLTPVLAGGLMLGCRALDEGRELTVEHLFAGFQAPVNKLLMVGGLYFASFVVIALICGVFTMLFVGVSALGTVASGGFGPALASLGIGFMLVVLIAFVLFIPVAMAICFAPALVVFNNLAPVEAMRNSFFACLKNAIPFLVYGVVYIVLAVIASIPLFLGWLVLGPCMIASMYIAYLDIFVGESRH